jgi:uncharacterized membrane protein YbjE (DUF340 family)
MSKRSLITTIATTAFTLVPTAIAIACPMCKDSIPNSDAQQAGSLPGGFNTSVYFMLIAFFAMVGLSVGVITKGVYNANAQMKQRGFEVQESQRNEAR